jgi:hypothetical protein
MRRVPPETCDRDRECRASLRPDDAASLMDGLIGEPAE